MICEALDKSLFASLIVSGLNHELHKIVYRENFKIIYETTDTDIENGTTDITRPELKAVIRGKINTGEITSLSLDVKDGGAISDTFLDRNKAGDYYREILNENREKIVGGYKYKVEIGGTVQSTISIPGKVGNILPTSYNFRFQLSFSYTSGTDISQWISTEYKFKIRYEKYNINTKWLGVKTSEQVSFY